MALQFFYTFLIVMGTTAVIYAANRQEFKDDPASYKILNSAWKVSVVGAFLSSICAVWGL